MWDKQIDEVAHDLTSRRAPAGLRARVLARIESTTGPRLRWVPIAVASLTAIVVVAFLIVIGSNRRNRVVTPTIAHADVPSSSKELDGVIARDTPAPRVTSRIADGLREVRRLRVENERNPPVRLTALESALEAPDPLAVDALRLPMLAPEIPVTIEPLVTEPIVLEALDIRPIDKPAFGPSIDEGDR